MGDLSSPLLSMLPHHLSRGGFILIFFLSGVRLAADTSLIGSTRHLFVSASSITPGFYNGHLADTTAPAAGDYSLRITGDAPAGRFSSEQSTTITANGVTGFLAAETDAINTAFYRGSSVSTLYADFAVDRPTKYTLTITPSVSTTRGSGAGRGYVAAVGLGSPTGRALEYPRSSNRIPAYIENNLVPPEAPQARELTGVVQPGTVRFGAEVENSLSPDLAWRTSMQIRLTFATLLAPTITVQPTPPNVQLGAKVALAVGAQGDFLTYQWTRDGQALAGETASSLILENFGPAQEGNYTVTVANQAGTVTSTAVSVSLRSRLTALSSRAFVGTGDNIAIGGFVIRGTGSRDILLRAVGPRLGALDVAGFVADPKLTLFNAAGQIIASNDNWSDNGATASNEVAAATARAGAFSLLPNDKDASLLVRLAPGSYTMHASGNATSTGVALAEIYDASGNNTSSSVVSLSTRSVINTGSGIIIQGIAVDSAAPKRLLIRAVGPRLADLNVTGFVTDPRLEIFDSTQKRIAANDNWSEGLSDTAIAELEAAFGQAGMFSLLRGSRDAAMIITLPSGNYTVQASGVNNTTGIALVEVYGF